MSLARRRAQTPKWVTQPQAVGALLPAIHHARLGAGGVTTEASHGFSLHRATIRCAVNTRMPTIMFRSAPSDRIPIPTRVK